MLLRYSRIISLHMLYLLITYGAHAQKKHKTSDTSGDSKTPVLWEPVIIADRDLFAGPGGQEMAPDLSKIEFVSDDKKGNTLKYKIKDGAGNKWTAKIAHEAQSEVAASRFLWALGYKTEINYLVPSITIPGKGTFTNVRLKAKPEDTKSGNN